MVQGVGYTKLQNNQISNQCNMLLETEKTKKGHLGLFGFQESTPLPEA